jgi:hypothetical protein
MAALARIGGKQTAELNETIALNDVESDVEKARFDHQAKLFALQQEFNARRDALRSEYHAKVEVWGDARALPAFSL